MNVIGECSGPTQYHIREVVEAVGGTVPRNRKRTLSDDHLLISDLEPLKVDKFKFHQHCRKCKVAGSRKFCRLTKNGQYDGALSIAKLQVENDVQIWISMWTKAC